MNTEKQVSAMSVLVSVAFGQSSLRADRQILCETHRAKSTDIDSNERAFMLSSLAQRFGRRL
jgi:hypothetical protein